MRESSDTAQTLYHAQRTEMCVKIQTVKAEISYNNNNNDRLTAFDPGQPG